MIQGWRREVAAFYYTQEEKLLGPSDRLIGYGNKMKEKSMESMMTYGFLNQRQYSEIYDTVLLSQKKKLKVKKVNENQDFSGWVSGPTLINSIITLYSDHAV